MNSIQIQDISMVLMKLLWIAHTISSSSKIILSTNGGKIKKNVWLVLKTMNKSNLTENLSKRWDVQARLVPGMQENENLILNW